MFNLNRIQNQAKYLGDKVNSIFRISNLPKVYVFLMLNFTIATLYLLICQIRLKPHCIYWYVTYDHGQVIFIY